MKNYFFPIFIFVLITFAGWDCKPRPSAKFLENGENFEISGNADDGDNEHPRDTYKAPDKVKAVDRLTKSISFEPKFNEVSGAATAESEKPANDPEAGNLADASSLNKILPLLEVTHGRNFNFDIELPVEHVKIRHEGTLIIHLNSAITKIDSLEYQPLLKLMERDFDFGKGAGGEPGVKVAGDSS